MSFNSSINLFASIIFSASNAFPVSNIFFLISLVSGSNRT